MLRSVLPIVVALLVLFAAIYAVFAPDLAPPTPAGPGPIAQGPATNPAPGQNPPGAVRPPPQPVASAPDFPTLPPVSIRAANTLIADPFPNDPALAPTRVSLDLHQADEVSAFLALAEAGKSPITLPPLPRIRVPRPLLELRASNMPLLEALFQLEAQSGMIDRPAWTDAIPLETPSRRVPGEWCVSGPFAVLINSVSHTATVRPPGAAPAADSLSLLFATRAEPRAGVLRNPGRLDLQEAVDENGNSLLRPTPAGSNGQQYSTSPQFSMSFAYPAQNGGRLIKRLKGTAPFLVRGDTKTLAITDPMLAKPAPISLGQITASVSEMKWNRGGQTLEVAVTYQRGATAPADWQTLGPILQSLRPALQFNGDFLAAPAQTSGQVTPEQVTATYSLRVTVKGNAGVQLTEPPPVTQFSIDVPTTLKPVAVPVEFHDVPLP